MLAHSAACASALGIMYGVILSVKHMLFGAHANVPIVWPQRQGSCSLQRFQAMPVLQKMFVKEAISSKTACMLSASIS